VDDADRRVILIGFGGRENGLILAIVYPCEMKLILAGMIDEEGYVHIMSRSDDIINVAAHRLSTGISPNYKVNG
jgi:propionyl-CoA synthetase